jgi:hypothetical protein
MGGIFMTFAIEMGSGAMTKISSFIQIGSDIQKLIRGITKAIRQDADRVSLLYFFKIRKVAKNIKETGI